MRNIHLVVIDPQNDFCLLDGALSVPGALDDMNRLATMVDRLGSKIRDIHVTLDCHHLNDIAHPTWWIDSSGNNPNPFSVITAAQVENGEWTTRIPSLRNRSLEYLKALEAGGRYPHVIWPPHCLIGTSGNAVVEPLMGAFNRWAVKNFGIIDFVSKGSNVFTEHFSGIQAEVPDPEDPTTQVNTTFVETLESADLILLAGEASSHCLANTVRDIGANFSDPAFIQKLVFLEDASSPVPTFEQYEADFLVEMKMKGMQVSTTVDFLA